MRLLALDLLRYGHLADVTLRFPADAGLHVVLGANEAGKSTALAAIGDALFGFPHVTRFAFQHEAADLRIGFEVAARDGTRAAFLRRKGRKDTLLDPVGNVVPEAALQRFLGGAGRDLFEKAFGLNAVTLRDGARSLIEGGGAAGEGLLAGMGLPHLRRVLDRLEKSADELHGTRHRTRRLPDAAERWQVAQRQLEQAAVKPAEWTESMAALERARAALADLATEAAELKADEVRLRRARAVRQPLAVLERLRDALAPLADPPALPDDAAATLGQLKAASEKAAEEAERDGQAATRLEAERAALARDPDVLAVQDAVDALAGLRTTALAAERDLPEVRQEAAAQRERIVLAEGDLELGAAPEAVRDALPPESRRAAAQRLIRRRAAFLTRLETAETRLREAERRLDVTKAAIAVAARPEPAAPLRRAIEAARAEGPLDRDISEATREAERAAASAAAAVATLALWTGDAAALAACPLPLPAVADEAAGRLETARAAQATASRALADAAERLAAREAELVQLGRGETMPTRDVIAEARLRRDSAWMTLRRSLEAGTMLPPSVSPEVFEQLRDAADRLADRRADEAARVQDYSACAADITLLRERRVGLEAASLTATAGLAAAEADWQALWSPAGIRPLSPQAMREWRVERGKVLDLTARADDLRARRDALVERREAACALLAPLLPAPHGPPLAPLLARAEAACTMLEAAEAAYAKLSEVAAQQAAQADEARVQHAAARAEFDADAAEWRSAITGLGLPPTAALDDVERALSAWATIAQAASAWRVAETRIAAMEAALAALERETAALVQRLGMASTEPPAATAAQLARRLAAAREAETEARGLERQAQEHRRAAAAAEERRRVAQAGLARLHAAAGTAELPALEEAVRRAAERDRLLAGIAEQEAALQEQGEARPEDELRAEVAGFERDAIAPRLEEIRHRLAALDERRPQLGAECQRLEDALAAMQRGRDAALIAQDGRQALAEAQAAAERYARLHAARVLLKAGVEQLRQSQQGPILRAATAHFRLLTGGRYIRLETREEDDGSAVLRAVRDDGTACPMEQLSEGARDQLFLALRAAALEAQAEAAEPLPFIADDLLASFDEARAAAALQLLAGLGRGVQVILFTHHAHVADMAAGLPGATVLRLPGSAGSPSAALSAA
jgi:uncharacterized protein YhaN